MQFNWTDIFNGLCSFPLYWSYLKSFFPLKCWKIDNYIKMNFPFLFRFEFIISNGYVCWNVRFWNDFNFQTFMFSNKHFWNPSTQQSQMCQNGAFLTNVYYHRKTFDINKLNLLMTFDMKTEISNRKQIFPLMWLGY